MKSIEESVVTAMDGSDPELFPYLPYILQDLFEIGSSPEVILKLVRKHAENHSSLSALDLGCGKGAVSIKLAEAFQCKCIGFDAVREFIEEADKKAKERGVESLCRFKVGDIREIIRTLPQFDVIILGSIGPVFGDTFSTLSALSKCLTQKGMIILDDGYIEKDGKFSHPFIQKKEILLHQIEKSGMQLVDEMVQNKDAIQNSNNFIFQRIKKRCDELTLKHPDKSGLFADYVLKQEEENDVLETKIVCSAMVIRKK